MGSPESENDHLSDEGEVEVALTHGFWLGRTEATQGQWERLMGTTPWKGKERVEEGADFPATYIRWCEADDFCRKLTESEREAKRLPSGWRYTLPTEAQWEYACRAGTTTAFSFGDSASVLSDYGWWGGAPPREGNAGNERYPHRVGLKKANPWGLYDMHGNVTEWCQDWYAARRAGGTDPVGPDNHSEEDEKVHRGGSWNYPARHNRSATRAKRNPTDRIQYLGFRIALSGSK